MGEGRDQDVTVSARARELARHELVIRNAQDGFWTSDGEGKIREANQAYARMSGYSVAELVGKPIAEIDANEDAEAMRAHAALVIERGYDCFETRHRRKDGSLLHVEVSVTHQRESGLFFAFCRDIGERKETERRLLHQRALLDEAQRLGKLGVWELTLATGELSWSDEIFRLFELDPARFRPSYEAFLAVVHPDDRARVNAAYLRSLENREPYDIVHRLRLPDGRIKWVRERCTSEHDEAGKPLRSVGAVQDITDHKRVEDELRITAAAFETSEAMLITDVHATILRVNRAFELVTGYAAAEVLGKNPRLLNSGRQDAAFFRDMWAQLRERGVWAGEMWDRRKSGEVYPKWLTITAVKNAAGETTEYVGSFADITERKKAEEEIRSLAFYDALTGLPNRRLLLERARTALTSSARSQAFGAILFLDMDRFKVLNDTLGHDFGDLMLIEVAARTRGGVRDTDTVARIGGDEFVVLLEGVSHDASDASRRVAVVAEKLRETLAQPYGLRDAVHHSSPSIGVSLFRGAAVGVETLLKQADMAMYQAKEAGRNTVFFFDPAMQHAVEKRALLESDLRKAVIGGELCPYYQVQVGRDGRVRGVEALVRWLHPRRGMVLPGQFIPVAEESSLIVDVGGQVLASACAQLARWRERELTRDLRISVNVSGAQFRRHDFVARVLAAVRVHAIDTTRLELELTESVVLADLDEVVAKMRELRDLGVSLSIDDFGTGYSSLSYLKRLPVTQIKIDRSFVADLGADGSGAVMVRTIIDLARNFGLEVVAEGVETEEQRRFLERHGCSLYQGYLFGRPAPIAELEDSLVRLKDAEAVLVGT